MAVAGRVAIVPKGEWNTQTAYKRLDAVTHNNTLYFAKKDVPAGTATENTEYWMKSIGTSQTIPIATEDADGLMSKNDKKKLNGLKKYTPDGTTITADEDGTLHGSSQVDIATTAKAGIVKPDGKSMSVDESGTLSINLDGTTITLDEAKNVIKLADALKDKIGSALQPESIVNNQITTVEGFALDARQANPNIDGSLAKQISDLNGSLNFIFNVPQTFTSFANIPNVPGVHIYCVANDGVSIPDSPYPGKRGWWNVINFGYIGRMTQITSQAYKTADYDYKGKDELWIRSLHDVTWSEWVKL